MRLHVYKAVSGGYDAVRTTADVCPGETGIKRTLHVSPKKGLEGILWNRGLKIVGYPAGLEASLYLDGSIFPKKHVPLRLLVEQWLDGYDMALFKHPHRSCCYVEVDACVARKKIDSKQAAKARSMLLDRSAKPNDGLWSCGIIARRSGVPWIEALMPKWWELTQKVPRDQIWLPTLLTGAIRDRVRTIEANIENNEWFTLRHHR